MLHWLLTVFLLVPILALLLITYFLGRPENNGSFSKAFKELVGVLGGWDFAWNLLLIFLLVWQLLLVGPILFLWLYATKQIEIYR